MEYKQPLTQKHLDEMNGISSIEEMDKYLNNLKDDTLSNYWSWVKKTTEDQIDEYLDAQKLSETIRSKAAVIMLELGKKCRFPVAAGALSCTTSNNLFELGRNAEFFYFFSKQLPSLEKIGLDNRE